MSGTLPTRLATVAALGFVVSIAAVLIDVRAVLAAYLATAATISSIAVGAAAVLMMTYVVRGHWTEALHLPLTAAALTTPVAGLLFIPVLIGIPWLYPWAQALPAEAGWFKAIWLTPWFFFARTVLYFAIWTALAFWVRNAWADPRRMVASASAGLIVYALTASFAGIDWLESLTPEFHSSIYGLLFLTFQLLSGFAFALTVVLLRRDAPTFGYGAILLSVLLMWAYNHAMQYIIIWSGNIPEEVVWYVKREDGFWGVVLWALVTLQFIAPFFALLLTRVRNGRGPLLAIAALTLALRFVEAYVLALPELDLGGAALMLAIAGTVLFAGALWWVAFEIAFAHVRTRADDTQPLPNGFDQSGSPASPSPSSS